MQLGGVHAIVTGGSSGIGLETARRLGDRGARVSLVARDRTRLAAAQRETGAIATASIDVTDPDAVANGFARLTAAHGPCDLLVTSAGAAEPGYFERLDAQVFRDQMDLDYFGTLHCVRAVVPAMLEQGGGTIVGISSTAGLIGVFGFTAYAPAKYAVRGLMDALRAELAPRGIRVSCVYPPDTDTPGLARENLTKPPETVAVSGSIKAVPPEKVAAAIVRGIERDRADITCDPRTALVLRGGGLLAPVIGRMMARQVRRVANP
ncbi:MAG TPA: SDR family oxidoreductase [Acidimicrobiia bacterium]|nr:SDR family oxidoreductase [Acidimicrobiia bacterium]